MPSKKDLIEEHKKLIPLLREGTKDEREAEAADQAKELADMQKEELVFAKNGQWSLVKMSNYGPKGAGLYDPVANSKRKENNTGQSVEDAGRNKNVKEYTNIQGTAQAQAKALAAKQAKLNAKQPVKTEIPPELKAKLEAEANKPKPAKKP